MELVTVSAEGAAAELKGITGTRTNLEPSCTMGVLPGGGPGGTIETPSFKDAVCSEGEKVIYEQHKHLIMDNSVLSAFYIRESFTY